MDEPLFESLLREEESEVLDFKREQYRFVKASDDDKSELLKDLLGFANAWRRSDAYILIGVEDVRGGRGRLVGISEQLDDHALQQFVNHQTNRPIRFRYEAFSFEGHAVGVIRIDLAQSRPVFLNRDYGRLHRERVYVRRGSGTDPTKPAAPDEIAEMGRSGIDSFEQSELLVQFAESDRDVVAGVTLEWAARNLIAPPRKSIPRFSVSSSPMVSITLENANPDYYRDLAKYVAFMAVFRRVRLVIENTGKTVARDVRLEFTIVKGGTIELSESAPREPKRFYSIGLLNPAIENLRTSHPSPGDVDLVDSGDGWRLEIDCGDLQPGRRIWTERFYLAVRKSGPAVLSGAVYASTLAQPKPFTLAVDATVTDHELSADDIRKMAAEAAKKGLHR